MGALAPAGPWIPEDDLLLKNAVEAGASLESLAKGAVQFSRRYTVGELQDRWHSLLYDPIISAEASTHMIEFERSSSTLHSKLNKFGSSKDNKWISGKRKSDSVRSCYYALRKRICNEPFNPMDLSYIVGPSDSNYVRNENGHLNGSYILADPNSNHFELQDSDLEIMQQAFPLLMDDVIPDEDIPVEQNTIPDALGKDVGLLDSQVGELCQSKEIPVCSLIEANVLGGKPSSPFTQINHDGENICSEMEQGHVFSSPILDCGASFHGLDCSSPLPGMPIWKAVEGISMPSLPDDIRIAEKDIHEGETFIIPGNSNKDASTSGYEFIHSESNLLSQMPSDQLKTSAATAEGYLEELSKSLLNFNDEEELLFMDSDGKDVIDKSYYDGLSSLLLNSPNDANQEEMPSMTEGMIVTSDACFPNKSGICEQETEDNRTMSDFGSHFVCKKDDQTLTNVSISTPQFPQKCEGQLFCAFNMEDPEIPCNDDVIFPKNFLPSSASVKSKCRFQENNGFSSSPKECGVNQRTLERVPGLMQREHHGQCHAPSQTGSQIPGKPSFNLPVGVRGIKSEVSNGDSRLVTARTTGIISNIPDETDSSTIRSEHVSKVTLKEEPAEILHNSTDAALNKLLQSSDDFQRLGHANAGECIQRMDAPGVLQDPLLLQSGNGSMDLTILDSVTGINPSAAESVESDDDVPSFSDIEAMILDMDLEPDDQDLFSNEEVRRYNNEETRRKIVRLEQGAHSYMQRSIASHGAFAVLYGRYSKHYIRKPEVLLGRGTEDFTVDIDLGKEGRFNKISRRQAIIKLERTGSFLLKNLGKCSILVNNKEVTPGQSLSLTSNCLVEIRGMPFIFETNPRSVKQFLDCSMEKLQT